MAIIKNNQKIWTEISKAKNVLLHLHTSPDADSMGSALSFMFVLKQLKKKVTLIKGDSDIPKNLSHLPGVVKITHKNYFQIDIKKFDLFIILDSSSLEQISKIKPVIFPSTLKTIVIDHHDTNVGFGDINLIESGAPATCQILYNLYKSNKKIKINKDIATCLISGIYTDTGGFKYSNTTDRTFAVASELAKLNPEFPKTIFEIENNDKPDRLKYLSIILASIETFYSGHVAIASLSFESIKSNNIDNSVVSTSDVANMIKSVTGWQIGVCMVETQENFVKASFRTRDSSKYDLSKIAAATGSGGGHKAAAGAVIRFPLKEAKKIVLNTIIELYPNLKKSNK